MGNKRQSADRQPVLPPEIKGALAEAIAPIEPAAGRLAVVRSAVLNRVRSDAQRFVTVRAADGTWIPLAPDVAYKMLDDDGAMQAFMLKLDPGACLPGHDHPGDEVCLVLEGSMWIGDLLIKAGDYHLARSGSAHADVRSDSGALVFIRTASGVMPHAPSG